MKVTITHMKAPWPSGARVGDVVDVPGDVVPAWAVGKCSPAAEVEVSEPVEQSPETDPASATEQPAEVEAPVAADKPSKGKREKA